MGAGIGRVGSGFAFLVAFSGELHFGLFEGHGAGDEDAGDDPDEGEKEHAEDEPGQGESADPLCHDVRDKIVRQGQAEEKDEKGGGAGDGEAQLAAHEVVQKLLAVNEIVVIRILMGHGRKV